MQTVAKSQFGLPGFAAMKRPAFIQKFRAGSRMDWPAIGRTLREIGYDGYVVLEPFVRMGGQVGKDISIWRDISCGADDARLDQDAADSVRFLRDLWG